MVSTPGSADNAVVHADPRNLGHLGFRDADYPALFRAADAASRRARIAHTRLIGIELGLLIAAAAIGTLQSLLSEMSNGWTRALPAVLLAAALIVKLANRLQRSDEQWFDGRAVAETVKTASWRYAMRVRPYDGEGAESDNRFAEALGETLAARPALAAPLHSQPSGEQQVISERMRALRQLTWEEQRAIYLASRVDNQEAWYAGKSRSNTRSATTWFWVSLGFEGLALAAAILMAVMNTGFDLIGPLAAISAGATAWTQLGRHDELAKSYGLAAHELMLLRARLTLGTNADTFRQGVEETESAISREHTMWMAKRS